jgi:hypothetical protein
LNGVANNYLSKEDFWTIVAMNGIRLQKVPIVFLLNYRMKYEVTSE